MIKIDCLADLHGHYPQLEGGDLLIVAGDLTARDTALEHVQFQIWLHDQDYKKKVVIAGNHDNRLNLLGVRGIQRQYEEIGENYLCDSGAEFEGLKIWGSPWSKTFPGMNPHCKAFTVDTEEELAEKWALIPDDVDILVTHSPAYTIRDGKNPEHNLGSTSLMKRMAKIKNLKLQVFGHIHEGYGKMDLRWLETKDGFKGAIYVNASHVDENYRPINKPIRIEL